MSGELIPADLRTALETVESVSQQYGLAALENKNNLERTLMMSAGMTELKKLLTPAVMAPIMALQGTSLGFRTDKDRDGGYPLEVVRDVACDALLRGFRMVGNEVNIIAGQFYAAKNGCRRRVLEWPGLTEFALELSFPTDKGGCAYVDGLASWSLDGTPDQLERRGKTAIPIKRNAGMGDDAILGKAERKMYAAVLNRLSSFIVTPEGEVDAEVNGQQQARVKRSSLNDWADAPPQEKAAPQFSESEQTGAVASYASRLDSATTAKDVIAVQKEAAGAAQAQSLSPDSLAKVNELANKRRAALKELFS